MIKIQYSGAEWGLEISSVLWIIPRVQGKGLGFIMSKVSNKRTGLQSGQSQADISAWDAFLSRARILKNVLSCLFHKLTQAKAGQKKLCVQWDVFFSLPLEAFHSLPTHASLLAPFPDRGGLAGGLSRGAHFGRKVRGNVFRSSYFEASQCLRFTMSVWVKGRVLFCLRNPQITFWYVKSSSLHIVWTVLAYIYSFIHSLTHPLI